MMNFHHMNVTFPKYFLRQFGEDAPFELVLAINPIVIIFLVPAVTYLIDLWRLDYGTVLVVGSLISGVSPFALAVLNSTQGAIVWMVMLSLGEAIWSPKLMEMSVAVAPEGREGTYMSLTSAPLLISKLGVGGLSGALLTQFCPEEGDCPGLGRVDGRRLHHVPPDPRAAAAALAPLRAPGLGRGRAVRLPVPVAEGGLHRRRQRARVRRLLSTLPGQRMATTKGDQLHTSRPPKRSVDLRAPVLVVPA
ncbi:unnamed protein product [Prorocentrum cordatum]|uniref:Solute carrier family 40 protein n=1 Tax=Prorocentrum cordatum TaxID=2364126 RepID=A0ABN9SWG7_9DINO|nr:unnamed protein product [Polarella glacialis]